MISRAIEIVKENPWKVTLGTIITVCVTMGSFYFTDMRYVKKADYEKEKQLIIEEAVKSAREEIKNLSK